MAKRPKLRLKWRKVGKERWETECGNYAIWVQARVREGMTLIKEYGVQHRDEPWLSASSSFWEGKEMCERHHAQKAIAAAKEF